MLKSPSMDKVLDFKGYGTRCFAFLLDAGVSLVLSIVLYFTLGKYGIESPLGYEAKREAMSSLVDESGLADEKGTAFYFDPIGEDGTLGADEYGSIVWDYYYTVAVNPDLRFYPEDGFLGDETDAEAVGRWIYEHVYGYDGSSINPYFALPSSLTDKPEYSDSIKGQLADEESKEEAAERLLSFYYRVEDGVAKGAYVDAFYHFSEQPVYLSLYQECSDILYFESLPSILIPPLLIFGLVPSLFKGRTVGKLVFRLHLVDKDGKQARWHQCLRHYLFIALLFMLPALPLSASFLILLSGFLFLVDFIVLLMSKRKQSLHDRLSGTLVYGVIGTEETVDNHDGIEENADQGSE